MESTYQRLSVRRLDIPCLIGGDLSRVQRAAPDRHRVEIAREIDVRAAHPQAFERERALAGPGEGPRRRRRHADDRGRLSFSARRASVLTVRSAVVVYVSESWITTVWRHGAERAQDRARSPPPATWTSPAAIGAFGFPGSRRSYAPAPIVEEKPW